MVYLCVRFYSSRRNGLVRERGARVLELCGERSDDVVKVKLEKVDRCSHDAIAKTIFGSREPSAVGVALASPG